MHTLLIVAVTADTAEAAEAAADEFLTDTEIGDWWAVGGRWSGFLDGRNTLCAGDDPKRFQEIVDEMLNIRLRRMNDLRQHLTGPDIDAELYSPFGLLSADEDESRERQRAWHQESSEQFWALIHDRGHPQAMDWTIGVHLRQLATMLLSDVYVEAGIVDGYRHLTDVDGLVDRARTDPREQWLVVVDVRT